MNAEEFEKLLKKTMSPGKCREALIGSDFLADVTFILGDNMEELFASKLFLSSASPILHQVFANQPDTEPFMVIRIDDVTKPTMIEVLRFAYCQTVKWDKNNMIEIMQAAAKLQMKALIEMFLVFLKKEGMTEKTVFKLLDANHEEKNLVINIECFTFIEKNHQKCFKSREFLSCSSESFRLILQACRLPKSVAKEAITLWSRHPGNDADDVEGLFSLFGDDNQ